MLVIGGLLKHAPPVIETWIEYKRTNEIDPVRLRPHEFELYYDV